MCGCPAGRTKALPGLLPLQPRPTVTAEVAFEQVLHRMGQMRPDGIRSARERQERKRQQQQWCAEAARSEAGAWNRQRSRDHWQPDSRTNRATPHEPGPGPGQYKPCNNSGQYPLSPAAAKPLLSRADLLPDCYQEALPQQSKLPVFIFELFL
jgi:hypothetical protein